MGGPVEGRRGRAAEVGDAGMVGRGRAQGIADLRQHRRRCRRGREGQRAERPGGKLFSTHGFNAGGAVEKPEEIYARSHPPKKNKDMFANAKAQAWWLVADRFRNTYNAVKKGQKFPPDELIFLSSEMDHLTTTTTLG
jgi:hypothetical protein